MLSALRVRMDFTLLLGSRFSSHAPDLNYFIKKPVNQQSIKKGMTLCHAFE